MHLQKFSNMKKRRDGSASAGLYTITMHSRQKPFDRQRNHCQYLKDTKIMTFFLTWKKFPISVDFFFILRNNFICKVIEQWY